MIEGTSKHGFRLRPIRIGAVLISALLTQACATTYQKGAYSWTGGYQQQQGPGDLVKINFAGNAFISGDKIAIFNLYRCAEFAKEQGKTHFIAYNSLVDAAIDRRAEGTTVGYIGGKPFSFAFVLLRDASEPGSWEAQKVLDRYQSIVHPPKPKPKSKSKSKSKSTRRSPLGNKGASDSDKD